MMVLVAFATVDGRAAEGHAPWLWIGAVTHQQATVVASLPGPSTPGRLQCVDAQGNAAPVTWEDRGGSVGAWTFRELLPATTYTLREGTTEQGSFRTFPTPGQPASFRLAFGSCNNQPNSPVFTAIRALAPDLMLFTGDFFYGDINTPDLALYRRYYDLNLSAPKQGEMLRHTPVAYMWDDHDFGPNNSNSSSPSAPAAHEAYRLFVPHYPLWEKKAQGEIGQAFTVGRVRFILTDLRSGKIEGQYLMSPAQRSWFERELVEAAKTHATLIWVSSVPWIARNKTSQDNWSAYPDERRSIATFIRDHGLAGKMAILAGDAHMCAIDDGTHSDYAPGGGAPLPLFHGAALDRGGSYKGGPYSHGAAPGGLRFGYMEVEDRGGAVSIYWSARDATDPTGQTILKATKDGSGPLEYRFTRR